MTSRLTGRLLAVAAALLLAGAMNGVSTSTAAASTSRPANAPIEAESYSTQHGTGTSTAPAPFPATKYVGWISNNDWTAYDNVDFGTGLHTWSATWASQDAGLNAGWIELHIDGLSTPAVASLPVQSTGSWFWFTTTSKALPYAITGVHQVELRFVTTTGKDFVNIDKFQFS